MRAKPKGYVLDSWSALAFLEDDAGAEAIGNVLADAQEHAIPVVMTVIDASDVWFYIAKGFSETIADQSIKSLQDLGVLIHDVDWKLAKQAGLLRSENKLSMQDSYTAALMILQKGFELVTGNQAFSVIDKIAKITWINK